MKMFVLSGRVSRFARNYHFSSDTTVFIPDKREKSVSYSIITFSGIKQISFPISLMCVVVAGSLPIMLGYNYCSKMCDWQESGAWNTEGRKRFE